MRLEILFGVGMDRIVPAPRLDPSGPHLHLGNDGTDKLRRLGVGDIVTVGWPEWDAETDRIPYDNNYFTGVWAFHFFEHINHFIFCLRECERVLAPGGVLTSVVPYGASHIAIQDPTHVRQFNEDTWATLMHNKYYSPAGEWKFKIGLNVIMGIVERNLCLVTQLIKEP